MTDENTIASLLGAAPRSPDPGFRFDVLARVASRARRRVQIWTALRQVMLFAAVGGFVAVLQRAHLDWAELRPLLFTAGTLIGAALLSSALIGGPRRLRADAAAALRGRIRSA